MEIHIDRSIPVPVKAQIKGQIEYGIAYGYIEPGGRLPNVHELARALQVSPVTVSQAYRELRDRGILTSAPGRGTFVAEDLPEQVGGADRYEALDAAIRNVFAQAELIGMPREQLIRRMQLSIAGGNERRTLRVGFVGVFRSAAEQYAATIRSHLDAEDVIEVFTVEDVLSGKAPPAFLALHVVLTFNHLVSELQESVPRGVPVLGVNIIPARETRSALAGIDPLARVGIVAAFPEFLTVLKKGIVSFAPHVEVAEAALAGTERADAVVRNCDVVVYASGVELGTPASATSQRIEYLHTPDPSFLRQTLLPRLARRRAQLADTGV